MTTIMTIIGCYSRLALLATALSSLVLSPTFVHCQADSCSVCECSLSNIQVLSHFIDTIISAHVDARLDAIRVNETVAEELDTIFANESGVGALVETKINDTVSATTAGLFQHSPGKHNLI